MKSQWANVVRQQEAKKIYSDNLIGIWLVFVDVKNLKKNPDGKIVGCVNCNHGRQNHDNEWRESARKNEQQSQKRDTDFG